MTTTTDTIKEFRKLWGSYHKHKDTEGLDVKIEQFLLSALEKSYMQGYKKAYSQFNNQKQDQPAEWEEGSWQKYLDIFGNEYISMGTARYVISLALSQQKQNLIREVEKMKRDFYSLKREGGKDWNKAYYEGICDVLSLLKGESR